MPNAERMGVLLEADLRVRRDKKWKRRFCLAQQLPADDSVQLAFFKTLKESQRPNANKRGDVVALRGFYGVESGFALDRESHTLAILCRSSTVVLALRTYEQLVEWEALVRWTFGHGLQFNVQVYTAPEDSALSAFAERNVRLHVHDERCCVGADCPPRVVAQWEMRELRAYGALHNKFCFDAGTRCGPRLAGVHLFLSSQSDQIHLAFKLAVQQQLHQYLTQRPMDTPGERRGVTVFSGATNGRVNSASCCEVLPPTPGGASLTSDRRPLLASVASSASVEQVDVQTEVHANEVFEGGSSQEDIEALPRPCIFSGHVAEGLAAAQRESLNVGAALRRYAVPVPIPICADGMPLVCTANELYRTSVALPTPPASASTPTSPPEKPFNFPSVSPHPALSPRRPPPQTHQCSICTEHRNYINQAFIDSLKCYYNFDAIFYPMSPAVLSTLVVPLPSVDYVSMSPSSQQQAYTAMEPSDAAVDSPPPDPALPVLCPLAERETRQHAVDVSQPPADPPTNSVPTWLASLPQAGRVTNSAGRAKQAQTLPTAARRTHSSCYPDAYSPLILPDRSGAVSAACAASQSGRRRTRSLFNGCPATVESVVSSAELDRPSALRESAKRARRLFGSFMSLKRDGAPASLQPDCATTLPRAKHSVSEPPTSLVISAAPTASRRHHGDGRHIDIDQLSRRLAEALTADEYSELRLSLKRTGNAFSTPSRSSAAERDVKPATRKLPPKLETIIDTSASGGSDMNMAACTAPCTPSSLPSAAYKGLVKVNAETPPDDDFLLRCSSQQLRAEFSRPAHVYRVPKAARVTTAPQQSAGRAPRALDDIGDAVSRLQGQQKERPPWRADSESLVFRFPERPPDMRMNYCEVATATGDTPLPTPRSAAPTARTEYAHIDEVATVATKAALSQRTAEHRNKSSSLLTLTAERSDSARVASRRFLPRRRISRKSSMGSLTDL